MSADSDQLSPVELLAEEFLERQQRGEKPTIGEYCDRHPELAAEIRDVFEAVAMVEELKPDSQDATGTFGTGLQSQTVALQQVGDYRILREVGRGGMGVVYEAEQESLNRRVALKVLPRSAAGDSKSLQRFQREARAAARMHHTNIVPVFEVGEDEDVVFYAMQLIHGQGLDLVVDDLRHLRIERSGPKSNDAALNPVVAAQQPAQSLAASLVSGHFEQRSLADSDGDADSVGSELTETFIATSGSTSSAVLPGQSELSTADSHHRAYFRSVAEIGLQTASALSYAHARGVIHRDIKPSNLLLDSTGVVWVTDFGLAKTSDSAMTHTGDILGTLRYMSPERFKGQCDVRADLYSLGLTLYEMLVLKPAFASPDRVKLIDLVTRTEPAAPRSIDSRIPRDLETIVLKACDKDPKRRYQSADDMADDLQRFINDEPIQARRVSVLEQIARWSRRNKALAASLSGLVASLVLIAGLMGLWAKSTGDANDSLTSINKEIDSLNEQLISAGEVKDNLLAERNALLKSTQKAESDAKQFAEQQRRRTYDSDMQIALALMLEEGSLKREVEDLLEFHEGSNKGLPAFNADEPDQPFDLRDHRYFYIRSQLENTSTSYDVPGQGLISAAFEPGGSILTLSAKGQLNRWGESQTTPLKQFDIAADTRGACRLAQLSDNGRFAALNTGDGWLHVYDLSGTAGPAGKPKRLFKSEVGYVLEMDFTYGGSELAVAATGLKHQLPHLPVSLEVKKSVQAGSDSFILFDNRLESDVEICWILPAGNLQQGAVLPTGRELGGHTIAGYSFAVKRKETGELVGVFTADDRPGRAVIDGRDPDQSREEIPGVSSLMYGDLSLSTFDVETGDANPGSIRKLPRSNAAVHVQNRFIRRRTDGAKVANIDRPLLRFSKSSDYFVIGCQPAHNDLMWGDRTDAVSESGDVQARSTMYAVAVSPDGAFVAGATAGTLCIARRDQETFNQVPVSGLITALEFSGTGELLATGDADGLVQVFDMSSPLHPTMMEQYRAHTQAISGIQFDGTGRRVISTTADGQIRVLTIGQDRQRVRLGNTGIHHGADISPDGSLLAFASLDGCEIWNLDPLYRRQTLPFRSLSCQFSPVDGLLAIGGAGDDFIRLVDLKTGDWTKLNSRFPEGTTDAGRMAGCVDFSRNGRFVAASYGGHSSSPTAGSFSTLVWDAETQRLVHEFSHDGGAIASVEFSERTLATASRFGELIVHSIPKQGSSQWEEIYRESLPALEQVANSPGGTQLALGFHDGSIELLDIDCGERVRLNGAPARITDLRYSEDGRLLIASCAGNVIRTWNVDSGRVVFKLPVDGHVTTIASLDRRAFAIAGRNGVYLWPTRPSAWADPAGAAELLDEDLNEASNAGVRRAIVRAAALHPETLSALQDLRPDDIGLQFAAAELLRLQGRDAEAAQQLRKAEVLSFKRLSERDDQTVAHSHAAAIQMRVFDKSVWETLTLDAAPDALDGEDPTELPSSSTTAPEAVTGRDQDLGVRVGGDSESHTFFADCPAGPIHGLRVEFLPEVGMTHSTELFELRELEVTTVDGDRRDPQPIPLSFFEPTANRQSLPSHCLDGDPETGWNCGVAVDGGRWAVFSCPDLKPVPSAKLKFVVRLGSGGGSSRMRLSVTHQPIERLPVSVAWLNNHAIDPERSALIRLATALYLDQEFDEAKEALGAASRYSDLSNDDQRLALILDALVLRELNLSNDRNDVFERATTPFARWKCQEIELALLNLAFSRLNGLEDDDAMLATTSFWRDCRREFLAAAIPQTVSPLLLRDNATGYLIDSNSWIDAAMEFERLCRTSQDAKSRSYDPIVSIDWMTAAALYAKAYREGQCELTDYAGLCNRMIDRYDDTTVFQGPGRTRKSCLLIPEAWNAIDHNKLQASIDALAAAESTSPYPEWTRLDESLIACREHRADDAIRLANPLIEGDGGNVVGATAAAIKALALASDSESRPDALVEAKAALTIAKTILHEHVEHNEDGSMSGRSLIRLHHFHNFLILDVLIQEAEAVLAAIES